MSLNILILAAHADDETLGCGGWIQRLISAGHKIHVVVLSDGNIKLRGEGIQNIESLKKALTILKITHFHSLGLPDQKLDTLSLGEIANQVLEFKIDPDVIISHHDLDLNLDHQIASQIAKIIGRPRGKPRSILSMEIPNGAAWNHKSFVPNFYVNIEAQLAKKLEAFSAYTHEVRKFPDPYSLEAIEVLAKLRGIESGHAAAEAFQILRLDESHVQKLAIGN